MLTDKKKRILFTASFCSTFYALSYCEDGEQHAKGVDADVGEVLEVHALSVVEVNVSTASSSGVQRRQGRGTWLYPLTR